MKTITRNHNFTNRIVRVEKRRKYFRVWKEKDVFSFIVDVTDGGREAFDNRDWAYFESAVACYFGGAL